MERDIEERFQRIEKNLESVSEQQKQQQKSDRSLRRMLGGGMRIVGELTERMADIEEKIDILANSQIKTEEKLQAFIDSLRKPSSN